jgi:hypothetical protein
LLCARCRNCKFIFVSIQQMIIQYHASKSFTLCPESQVLMCKLELQSNLTKLSN